MAWHILGEVPMRLDNWGEVRAAAVASIPPQFHFPPRSSERFVVKVVRQGPVIQHYWMWRDDCGWQDVIDGNNWD